MPVSDTRSCQAAVDSLRAERKAFAEQAEFLSKSFTVRGLAQLLKQCMRDAASPFLNYGLMQNLDTLHHLGAIPLVAELLQDSDAG